MYISINKQLTTAQNCFGVRGYEVAHLVEVLRYKPECRGFNFPMVSLELFIDIILPVALWPWD